MVFKYFLNWIEEDVRLSEFIGQNWKKHTLLWKTSV